MLRNVGKLLNFNKKLINPIIKRSFNKDASYEKLGLFKEFFDEPKNWDLEDIPRSRRPGREWTIDELRLKSNTDLHKLWPFPNDERNDRVKMSMENIEEVISERNNAFYELETGLPATPRKRRVTSFLGFTYEKQVEEHALPNEITKQKEYEIPYLDEDAYIMQKLWNEKKYWQDIELGNMKVLEDQKNESQVKYLRSLRKTYNDISQVKGLRYK
ncbi:39S ribosomal protein L47, mitochondrial [Strongyloides ratti]|uniref:Large ribosomal subunit protein uL29m n=1 Tax=Strongyloides ratti TaxID=34506 RepID=A0A090L7K9_STRRB|nr:39S ribosomal protein L47, mitochondrial [Strongyloides ratti]CEF65771.1 39S ribosomal protein L47, mitochondrial [Strongyloides ratti]